MCSAYAAVITIISTDIYLLRFWDGWEVLRSARLYACLCLSVCMSVCLSARISQKQHVKTLRNFLYMLPMAAARSSSDDNAIRYVFFPVLWMTMFSYNEVSGTMPIRQRYVLSSSPGGGTSRRRAPPLQERTLLSPIVLYYMMLVSGPKNTC